jgi:hypothetical protein
MRCRKGGYMSRYKVMVDDNFHYMEEDERDEVGTFPTIEEAITACKQIVDNSPRHLAKGKTYTPDELYDYYVSFGSDPSAAADCRRDATGTRGGHRHEQDDKPCAAADCRSGHD